MTNENNVGKINISDELLCSCVANSTRSFDGVMDIDVSAAGTALDILSKDLAVADGVRVTRKDGIATVDVYIQIEYGTKIPKLAWELQKRIQEDIKKITDEDISNINIHIEGVGVKESIHE